jgi:cyclic-di-GMP-binding protein
MDLFDTRPASVDKWLDELPLASVGETARQLYSALRNVNLQDDVPAKNYFHFLEGISQPLSLILPELHKHYAGKPLPLTAKRRKIASLYSQLILQAIEGYQRVISSSVELVLFGWKKVVTTAVHRILFYQSLMLCNYRLLYLPFPRGAWQQLYWLYQLIEKYELLDSKVSSLSKHSVKTTLENEYKKLLLISLLSPNLFRLSELHAVLDNMDRWPSYTTLSHQRPDNATYVYAFLCDTDMPPGLIAGSNAPSAKNLQMHYFDISALIAYINAQLTRVGEKTTNQAFWHEDSSDHRTLLLLLNTWGRPPVRDGERRPMAGQAELAIGMSAIHYLLAEGRGTFQPVTTPVKTNNTKSASLFSFDLPNGIDTPGTLDAATFHTDRDGVHDVWETAFFEPDAPPPSWTESISLKAYSYLEVGVLNVSKGGFCIGIPQESLQNIQTGELIALRGKNGQWQLGEIRWMVCPNNGPIRAGVKRLCSRVSQAQLHLDIGQTQTQPIRALVGEQEQGLTLFMPSLPTNLEGRHLSLEYNGQHHRFVFDATLDGSMQGNAYHIHLHDNRPSAPATITAATATATDRFAKVWTSL